MDRRKTVFAFTLAACVAIASACGPGGQSPLSGPGYRSNPGDKPTIEVSPATSQAGNWKVADADTVTVAVSAPGAESVRLLYRPSFADEGEFVRLKENVAAADKATGRFESKLKLPSDFAGDLWAEVTYAGGRTAQSDPIALRRSVDEGDAGAPAGAPPVTTSKASPDVSARSDSITGGTIEKAKLGEGNPDLRITINVPAFQLTLWQGGKEVATYAIGVGRKEFPLPSGSRVAREMVFNPDWVPPDSEWVRKEEKVEPGEPIEAGDPKNPLGDIKIPLGDAVLIHEAGKRSDLGNLVSHGCARMLQKDLLDLTEKIGAAQGLEPKGDALRKLVDGNERKHIGLKQPIPVDISYDTAVVEGGKLHLYPDVYDQKTATVENVRKELEASKVDVAKLDDKAIEGMLARVDRSKAFVVPVADIQSGNALAAGKALPIVALATGSQEDPSTAKEGTGKGRGAKGKRK